MASQKSLHCFYPYFAKFDGSIPQSWELTSFDGFEHATQKHMAAGMEQHALVSRVGLEPVPHNMTAFFKDPDPSGMPCSFLLNVEISNFIDKLFHSHMQNQKMVLMYRRWDPLTGEGSDNNKLINTQFTSLYVEFGTVDLPIGDSSAGLAPQIGSLNGEIHYQHTIEKEDATSSAGVTRNCYDFTTGKPGPKNSNALPNRTILQREPPNIAEALGQSLFVETHLSLG